MRSATRKHRLEKSKERIQAAPGAAGRLVRRCDERVNPLLIFVTIIAVLRIWSYEIVQDYLDIKTHIARVYLSETNQR